MLTVNMNVLTKIVFKGKFVLKNHQNIIYIYDL